MSLASCLITDSTYKKSDYFEKVKSKKKYRVLNHVKRLVIILLDPIYDVSQCCFFAFDPFKIITLIFNVEIIRIYDIFFIVISTI